VKKALLILFLVLPIFGQETPTQETKKEAAAPEKDMTPWMWANFVILTGALVYLSRKYGGPFFAARSEGIRKDIVNAEKTKSESEAKIAEVNAKLANLGAEIKAMKEENLRDQARETERLQSRHQAELARIHAQAQQEIQSATKMARLELQRQAAVLALDLAEKKVSARMNPETQNRLASGFVESIS
jgi:F-type H+-transporting ATPase subunit b